MTEIEYYDTFSHAFSWFQKRAHALAVEKGWYEVDRNPLELLALTMSEMGEAIEAIRERSRSKKILGYSGLEEEIADVFIRTMDQGEAEGMKLGHALVEMLGYLRHYSEQEIRLAFAMIKLMGVFPDERIAEAIIAKHQFNESRPNRHGGKLY